MQQASNWNNERYFKLHDFRFIWATADGYDYNYYLDYPNKDSKLKGIQ